MYRTWSKNITEILEEATMKSQLSIRPGHVNNAIRETNQLLSFLSHKVGIGPYIVWIHWRLIIGDPPIVNFSQKTIRFHLLTPLPFSNFTQNTGWSLTNSTLPVYVSATEIESWHGKFVTPPLWKSSPPVHTMNKYWQFDKITIALLQKILTNDKIKYEWKVALRGNNFSAA